MGWENLTWVTIRLLEMLFSFLLTWNFKGLQVSNEGGINLGAVNRAWQWHFRGMERLFGASLVLGYLLGVQCLFLMHASKCHPLLLSTFEILVKMVIGEVGHFTCLCFSLVIFFGASETSHGHP